MRTKLDEIVDDVVRDFPPTAGYGPKDWARASAERAYRLGAHDTVRSAIYTGSTFSIDRCVIPAPAERRKGPAERRVHQSAVNFVHPEFFGECPECAKVPTPPPGFTIKRKLGPGDFLTGPPELPRFEHTGEFRAPKRGEWFTLEGRIDVADEDWDVVAGCWILRKVGP